MPCWLCPCHLRGLQVFTNDAFFASNHRVLKSTGVERYSRAYFFNPSFKADITPSRDLTIASEYCGLILLLCAMLQVSCGHGNLHLCSTPGSEAPCGSPGDYVSTRRLCRTVLAVASAFAGIMFVSHRRLTWHAAP